MLREEATQELVRLATSIAARVIHREVAVDPDALAGLVTAAFSEASVARNQPRAHASRPGSAAAQVLEQFGVAGQSDALSPIPASSPVK